MEEEKSAGTSKGALIMRTLHATAGSHVDEAGFEGYLTDCEKLKPKVNCDRLYLSEVLPLLRRRPKTCAFVPVTLPTREIGKLCRLARSPKGFFQPA